MNLCLAQQNDFELSDIIGIGTFGTVYKGKEKKSGKMLAIKVIKGEDGISFKEQFMEEVKLLSELNYPMLLCLNAITTTPPYYIITEYFPHKSLQNYINQSSLNKEQENEWNINNKMISVIGIALGMRYLHSKNIAHCDLKPENVLFDSNFYPRICDFGLSKTMFSSQDNTLPNIATLLFYAPEVIKYGHKYDGYKADVYSYGIIVYSILYNSIPNSDISNQDILYKEIVENYKRPVLDGHISPTLDILINRCLDPDPEKRPDFNQIIDELIMNKKIIEELQDINIQKIENFLLFCKETNSVFKEKEIKELKIGSFQHMNSKELFENFISKGIDVKAKDINYQFMITLFLINVI